PLETTNVPWQLILTDFVTNLSKSKGFDLINMIVDKGLVKRHSHLPCKKTITAEETTILFQNNIFN
ncbi:hypothetical protein HETIRDRAFT_53170, partial [Heterobasidion irregulare TC 32-1]